MDADEIGELVEQIAQQRYPGRCRQPSPPELAGGGWVIEPEGAFCLIRAGRSAHPMMWMQAGVCLEIPTSAELAFFVARANKDLVSGRAYLAAGDQIAMVVMEDTIFGSALSWQYAESLQDLVDRLENLLRQAGTIQTAVREQFGGRPFSDEDWMHLVF